MSDVDILGSYWTLAGKAYPHTEREHSPFRLEERVRAAAEAGFTGIGLWHADLLHMLRERGLKEMRRVLDHYDMALELEFLRDWFLEPGQRRRQSDALRRVMLDAAETLGARHLKVGDFSNTPCPMEKLVEEFATLCDEAAERGTNVLYEFMPFANIHSLEDARTLVEGAGRDNGGVILDLWHIVYLGISYADLARFPSKYVMGVELNDGPLTRPDPLHEATVNGRLPCGEGEFDIRGFIRCARDDLGYEGPWGVEILNAELRERPLERIAGHVYETTVRQFEAL